MSPLVISSLCPGIILLCSLCLLTWERLQWGLLLHPGVLQYPFDRSHKVLQVSWLFHPPLADSNEAHSLSDGKPHVASQPSWGVQKMSVQEWKYVHNNVFKLIITGRIDTQVLEQFKIMVIQKWGTVPRRNVFFNIIKMAWWGNIHCTETISKFYLKVQVIWQFIL